MSGRRPSASPLTAVVHRGAAAFHDSRSDGSSHLLAPSRHATTAGIRVDDPGERRPEAAGADAGTRRRGDDEPRLPELGCGAACAYLSVSAAVTCRRRVFCWFRTLRRSVRRGRHPGGAGGPRPRPWPEGRWTRGRLAPVRARWLARPLADSPTRRPCLRTRRGEEAAAVGRCGAVSVRHQDPLSVRRWVTTIGQNKPAPTCGPVPFCKRS